MLSVSICDEFFMNDFINIVWNDLRINKIIDRRREKRLPLLRVYYGENAFVVRRKTQKNSHIAYDGKGFALYRTG